MHNTTITTTKTTTKKIKFSFINSFYLLHCLDYIHITLSLWYDLARLLKYMFVQYKVQKIGKYTALYKVHYFIYKLCKACCLPKEFSTKYAFKFKNKILFLSPCIFFDFIPYSCTGFLLILKHEDLHTICQLYYNILHLNIICFL